MSASEFAKVAIIILVSTFGVACASNNAAQQAQAGQTTTDATADEQTEQDEATNPDPLESLNRKIWDFNYNYLDRYILKPVTQGYVAVMPQPARTGLYNAAKNIEEPASAFNNLLQGKPGDSAVSVGRFAINSTIGILGLIDVATSMGLERKKEDFGQVLGVWGVGTGPYLMLPALGPSDFRSLTGRIVDSYYWPSTVLEDPYVIGAKVVGIIEARASLIEQEENLNRSLDQYLFVRDAYFQRLQFEVSDGEIKQKSEQELEEEEEDFSAFEDLLGDDGS